MAVRCPPGDNLMLHAAIHRAEPGSVVVVEVADEEGVVVVPGARREEVLTAARAKLAKEAAETLDDWESAHRARIDKILAEQGFEG